MNVIVLEISEFPSPKLTFSWDTSYTTWKFELPTQYLRRIENEFFASNNFMVWINKVSIRCLIAEVKVQRSIIKVGDTLSNRIDRGSNQIFIRKILASSRNYLVTSN